MSAAGQKPTTFVTWVDFIKVGSRRYLNRDAGAPFSLGSGRALVRDDLGSVFATVRFQVSGRIHEFPYHSRDGDAAFLPAGTPVYTVKGYVPAFRLAAWKPDPDGERLCLYEVDTNPHAQRGNDLLDIGGRVKSIHILSERGQTELARIDDAEQVRKLVDAALSAPVDQARQNQDGLRYFVSFALLDGTDVTRSYWPASGELARGILVPDDFTVAIEAALDPK